jgi:hypothetical protein
MINIVIEINVIDRDDIIMTFQNRIEGTKIISIRQQNNLSIVQSEDSRQSSYRLIHVIATMKPL